MAMTIFVPPDDIQKETPVRLSADKSHYLISVLRRREGDAVTIIDGLGKAYDARVSFISDKRVFVKIISEIAVDTESPVNLVLCQGVLKGEKMDMVIQKATELGIKEMVPVITDRGIVRQTRKVDRWKKIAEEAAEQCGRAVIPVIHGPMEYGRALSSLPAAPHGFIFWEQGGLSLSGAFQKNRPQSMISGPLYLFVGPEGGFTPEEVGLAEDKGLVRTTLGSRILRAETAAIAATALVQFLFDK